jgi:ribosomal protein S18 acetylase RimI-like enzyme
MPTPDPNDTALTIRPAQPGDEDAALRCYNEVFAVKPNEGTRSLAHWRWKFAANPPGRLAQMLAVHATAGVVGIYAAVPLFASCGGRRCLALQSVDHCVRPEWLRHGGNGGLFARLGQAFLDRWLGTSDDQAAFIYGLPVSSWRSGQRHLQWQIARDWDITFRELAPGAAARSLPHGLEVREVARFDADVDALWSRLAPTFGVATVRDRRWFDWRYAQHPDRRYELLACRGTGHNELRGVCVYGTGDAMRPRTSYVLDWLSPADDTDAMAAMLGACEQRTRRDGTGLLCSVWNHMDPRFLAMQDHGYRVCGTPWFLAVRSPTYDTTFFREKWYFTLGDADFV